MVLGWRILLCLALLFPAYSRADTEKKYCLASLLENSTEWASVQAVLPALDPSYQEKTATKKITMAFGFSGLLHCFSRENSYTHIFILAHATLLPTANSALSSEVHRDDRENQLAGIIYYSPEARLLPRQSLSYLQPKSLKLLAVI